MGGLPFSINADTGELIGVMEYSPGDMGENLVCPDCHQPVSVFCKQGRYHFTHREQSNCHLGARVGAMLALQAELDKPLIEPIEIALPALSVKVEISSPENPSFVLRDEAIWHRQVPPVTITKGKNGPHFYFRFTDSEVNNLALHLPPPDDATGAPEWLDGHTKRHMSIGLMRADYSALLAALSRKMLEPAPSDTTAEALFRLFLAEQDTKVWLYHPRELGIKTRLKKALEERLPAPSICRPATTNAPPAPICERTVDESIISPEAAQPETLLSPDQLAELVAREGQRGADPVLYSPDCCQLEIDDGWLVLKRDHLWLIDRTTSGDWSNRTIRFSGGMRSGRYVTASPELVRSIKSAVGYGNKQTND